MSYILDALRRADAERERGAVPGLQSSASPAADESEPARGAPGWLWPVAGVAVVLIGAVGWWLGAGSARPAPAAAPAAAPPAAPIDPVATAPAAPPPPQATRPEPAFLPPPPVRPPAPPMAGTPPRGALPDMPASAALQPPPPAAPRASGPAPAAAPAAAAAPVRLPTRDELPDELRRGLPALAVGGHMYSENADKRMLILDGRLLREGEALGNGLVLEQIRTRSAVLSVQGTRFELKF